MPSLVAVARCRACGQLGQGDPAAMDKLAEKHTAVGHATSVVTAWT